MIHLGTTIAGPHAGTHLHLPLDIATESTSIIARKGMGKTHTARVMAEGLLDHDVQVVVVDPLDVWWGIRTAKDGKGDGCNVVIFGGSHADLPLTEHAGASLADLIVDRGISAILVTDHLSIAASRRFLGDFGERMYDRKREEKHRTPISLIIDECDRFAPQQVTPDAARCTGVIDELARRGRSRGIGIVAISQRPAALNKNVLTQTELLICLQVTSPQDRKALGAWIEANADADQTDKFLDSLAGFKRGEAWIWSPSKLNLFSRVLIRDVKTYDSSYTPKVGESRPAAPRLRAVDLAALRTQLAETIEQAEASDPAKLRKEIAELKKRLAIQAPSAAEIERAAFIKRDEQWVGIISGGLAATNKALEAFARRPHFSIVMPPATSKSVAAVARAPIAGDADLSKGERAVLSVLASEDDGATQRKTAILAGYRLTSSTWRNILSKLRVKQAITNVGELLMITPTGSDLLGSFEPLPTGDALVSHWRTELGGGVPGRIFDALVDAYPASLSKAEMAAAGQTTITSSTLRNAISKLTVLELIDGRGDERTAAKELMNG